MARRSPKARPRKCATTNTCCRPISAAAPSQRPPWMPDRPMPDRLMPDTTSPGRKLLQFQNVNTYYGDLHVLKDVNYEIGEGEIVSLLGGNASGKSTTMKTIMGVVRPATGQVIFDGAP